MDNQEKNTYAKQQLTTALLILLQATPMEEISISMLTQKAGVSRMTFYRNYGDKKDILRQKISQMLEDWWQAYCLCPSHSVEDALGSLFYYFKQNQDFYLILFQNNLSHLILERFVEIAGPKPEMDNQTAYHQAYFAYGLYGWMCEWVNRGMQESADGMAQLLKKQ